MEGGVGAQGDCGVNDDSRLPGVMLGESVCPNCGGGYAYVSDQGWEVCSGLIFGG